MIPTLRIMTLKSKMKFGKWKDCTVQEMLEFNRNIQLVSAYFKLTSISYKDEILDNLGITKDWRINKPGSDKILYKKFLDEKYPKRYINKELNKLNRNYKPPSKSQLQSINHGH